MLSKLVALLEPVADFETPLSDGVTAQARRLGSALGASARSSDVPVDRVVDDVVRLSGRLTDAIVAGVEIDPEVSRPFDRLRLVKNAAAAAIAGMDAQERAVGRRRRQERGSILQAFSRTLTLEIRNRLGAAETALLMRPLIPQSPEHRQRLYGIVRGSIESAGATIDDVMSLTRYGDPSLYPVARAMSAHDLARRALGGFEARAESSGVTLRLGSVPDARVDEGPCRLILRNLIENGIEYRDRSCPEPFVEVTGSASEDWVTFQVRDNGIGIDPTLEGRVFDWSARLNESTPGEGLGLPLAREAAAQIGGSVQLEGARDGGTTVTVRVPVRR